MLRETVGSWGNVVRGEHASVSLRSRRDPFPRVDGVGTVLPYGNGRSYGDSCLNVGAGLVQTSEPHVAPGPDHEGTDRQPEQAAPELGVADHVNPFPWRMPGSARCAGYSFLARPIFSSAAFSLTMNASTDLR